MGFVCLLMIRILTNDFYFRMQFDTRLLQHRCPHFVNQIFNICRRRAAHIHDKVGVFFRYFRASNAPSFQSATFDQLCGMIARRIAEHRTCIWQIQGLGSAALVQQYLDRLPRFLDIALFQPEPGADEELFFGRDSQLGPVPECDMAVSDRYRTLLRAAFAAIARRAAQHQHALHPIPGLSAIAARIHCQRAAQCAGDPRKEFRPALIARCGKARQLGARHTGLRINQFTIHMQRGRCTTICTTVPRNPRRAPAGCCPGPRKAMARRRVGTAGNVAVVKIGRTIQALRHTARAPAQRRDMGSSWSISPRKLSAED